MRKSEIGKTIAGLDVVVDNVSPAFLAQERDEILRNLDESKTKLWELLLIRVPNPHVDKFESAQGKAADMPIEQQRYLIAQKIFEACSAYCFEGMRWKDKVAACKTSEDVGKLFRLSGIPEEQWGNPTWIWNAGWGSLVSAIKKDGRFMPWHTIKYGAARVYTGKTAKDFVNLMTAKDAAAWQRIAGEDQEKLLEELQARLDKAGLQQHPRETLCHAWSAAEENELHDQKAAKIGAARREFLQTFLLHIIPQYDPYAIWKESTEWCKTPQDFLVMFQALGSYRFEWTGRKTWYVENGLEGLALCLERDPRFQTWKKFLLWMFSGLFHSADDYIRFIENFGTTDEKAVLQRDDNQIGREYLQSKLEQLPLQPYSPWEAISRALGTPDALKERGKWDAARMLTKTADDVLTRHSSLPWKSKIEWCKTQADFRVLFTSLGAQGWEWLREDWAQKNFPGLKDAIYKDPRFKEGRYKWPWDNFKLWMMQEICTTQSLLDLIKQYGSPQQKSLIETEDIQDVITDMDQRRELLTTDMQHPWEIVCGAWSGRDDAEEEDDRKAAISNKRRVLSQAIVYALQQADGWSWSRRIAWCREPDDYCNLYRAVGMPEETWNFETMENLGLEGLYAAVNSKFGSYEKFIRFASKVFRNPSPEGFAKLVADLGSVGQRETVRNSDSVEIIRLISATWQQVSEEPHPWQSLVRFSATTRSDIDPEALHQLIGSIAPVVLQHDGMIWAQRISWCKTADDYKNLFQCLGIPDSEIRNSSWFSDNGFSGLMQAIRENKNFESWSVFVAFLDGLTQGLESKRAVQAEVVTLLDRARTKYTDFRKRFQLSDAIGEPQSLMTVEGSQDRWKHLCSIALSNEEIAGIENDEQRKSAEELLCVCQQAADLLLSISDATWAERMQNICSPEEYLRIFSLLRIPTGRWRRRWKTYNETQDDSERMLRPKVEDIILERFERSKKKFNSWIDMWLWKHKLQFPHDPSLPKEHAAEMKQELSVLAEEGMIGWKALCTLVPSLEQLNAMEDGVEKESLLRRLCVVNRWASHVFSSTGERWVWEDQVGNLESEDEYLRFLAIVGTKYGDWRSSIAIDRDIDGSLTRVINDKFGSHPEFVRRMDAFLWKMGWQFPRDDSLPQETCDVMLSELRTLAETGTIGWKALCTIVPSLEEVLGSGEENKDALEQKIFVGKKWAQILLDMKGREGWDDRIANLETEPDYLRLLTLLGLENGEWRTSGWVNAGLTRFLMNVCEKFGSYQDFVRWIDTWLWRSGLQCLEDPELHTPEANSIRSELTTAMQKQPERWHALCSITSSLEEMRGLSSAERSKMEERLVLLQRFATELLQNDRLGWEGRVNVLRSPQEHLRFLTLIGMQEDEWRKAKNFEANGDSADRGNLHMVCEALRKKFQGSHMDFMLWIDRWLWQKGIQFPVDNDLPQPTVNTMLDELRLLAENGEYLWKGLCAVVPAWEEVQAMPPGRDKDIVGNRLVVGV